MTAMTVTGMKYRFGGWWRPGQCGQTSIISKAARYGLSAASEIVSHANMRAPKDAQPDEVMVLAPECLGELTDA